MSADCDLCPFCGKRLLKGAMRCLSCGKILKTLDEQKASIRKHMESEKFNMGRLLGFVILLLAIGTIYYYFSDRIITLVNSLKITIFRYF